MTIRARYRGVIQRLVEQHQAHYGHFDVPASATYNQCLGYAHRYLVEGNVVHYRFDRYCGGLRILEHMYPAVPSTEIIHLDLGSGPGVFSWALIDTLAKPLMPLLYGYDHAPNMGRLAEEIWHLLNIPYEYQFLESADPLIAMVHALESKATIITMGHVLLQTANQPSARENFARIVAASARCQPCRLVAVDAHTGNRPKLFAQAWADFVSAVQGEGVVVDYKLLHQSRGCSEHAGGIEVSEQLAMDFGVATPSTEHAAARPRGTDETPQIEGLVYLPSFLSRTAQKMVVDHLDDSTWSTDLGRRVQQFGWRYDYRAKTVTADMRIGTLPAWLRPIAHRLYAESGMFDRVPDQVIVNEYLPGQGIAMHVDRQCFGAAIATISLGDAWHLDLKSLDDPQRPISRMLLEEGSALILTGPARYRWYHGIAKRKREQDGLGWRERRRRISLTFRTVLPMRGEQGGQTS